MENISIDDLTRREIITQLNDMIERKEVENKALFFGSVFTPQFWRYLNTNQRKVISNLPTQLNKEIDELKKLIKKLEKEQ